MFWTPTGLRYHLDYDWDTRIGHIYTGSSKTWGTEAEARLVGRTPCHHCFVAPAFICY